MCIQDVAITQRLTMTAPDALTIGAFGTVLIPTGPAVQAIFVSNGSAGLGFTFGKFGPAIPIPPYAMQLGAFTFAAALFRRDVGDMMNGNVWLTGNTGDTINLVLVSLSDDVDRSQQAVRFDGREPR